MKILEDTRTILTILVTLVGSIFWLATLSSQVLENKIVRTKLEKLER